MKLDINTNANIILTDKLERLNKSAFPSSVRSTLNDAAFEMKKSNILESAKKNMTVRNPTVFKKFTGVKRAAGFNVSSMYSEVGFIPKDGQSGSKVPEGMEHNEVGGIDNDGAMYLGKARTSNSLKKLVRRKNRFDKSKLAKGYKKSTKGGDSNVKRMVSSFLENAPVQIKTSKGTFLVQVTGLSSKRVGKRKGQLDIKLNFLMRSRTKNPARAKATHFNQEAAIKTSKQIEGFYAKNAEFQFNKVLKATR